MGMFMSKKTISTFLSILITLVGLTYDASAHDSIKKIYFEHEGDASGKWINYLDVYEECFSRYIGKNPNLIEIGVQNGGGLQIYSKYLKNAKIYGIDINPEVCKMNLGKNIKTFCFDINMKDKFLSNLKGVEFDIIIDDGSHMQDDMINTFEFLFDKLRAGGIYIVEDVHTSYWKSFKGKYKGKNTSVEYFKNLADYVNFYHIKEDFNSIKVQENLLTQKYIDKYVPWIESITFYDGIIAIKKYKKKKLTPHERIVVGKEQPVVPSIDIAKDAGYYIK